jgi:membrane-associated HD superfamily phosphohydrolase
MPYQWEIYPSRRTVYALTLISTTVTLFLTKVMSGINETLASRGYGIVDLELAFSKENVSHILNRWGPEFQLLAKKSLFFDFAYIAAYSVCLSTISILLARFTKKGFVIALFPFFAGFFDVIENILLLGFFDTVHPLSSLSVFIAGISALLKFSLLGIVFIFIILSFCYILYKRFK